MTHENLTLATCAAVLIIGFYLAARFTKEAAPQPRRRNIPIAHAYAEMLHIILNAQRVEEMNCIDCLISNMYTDYEGVVNYSDIANFENDIKNEQLKKRLELLHVEDYEFCFS